ncbi:MAG: hypothetical protein ACXAC7_01920, partial [Candidatus Hodarchaeales archaeon]
MLSTPTDTKKALITQRPPDIFEKNLGNSRPVKWYAVTKSSWKLYLNIIRRYPANLISIFIQIILFVFFFGLFASAVNFRGAQFVNFDSKAVFIFFLGGLSLAFFDGAALWSPLNSVKRDLYNGTLEYMYFNPVSRYGYFMGYILGSATFSFTVGFLPIFIFLIFFAGLDLNNTVMMLT